jgi:hypothetical protein
VPKRLAAAGVELSWQALMGEYLHLMFRTNILVPMTSCKATRRQPWQWRTGVAHAVLAVTAALTEYTLPSLVGRLIQCKEVDWLKFFHYWPREQAGKTTTCGPYSVVCG